MVIKTKLDPGSTAYIIFNNKIHKVKIETILTESNESDTMVIYKITKNPCGTQYTIRFFEDEIYTTKEEVLVSLSL